MKKLGYLAVLLGIVGFCVGCPQGPASAPDDGDTAVEETTTTDGDGSADKDATTDENGSATKDDFPVIGDPSAETSETIEVPKSTEETPVIDVDEHSETLGGESGMESAEQPEIPLPEIEFPSFESGTTEKPKAEKPAAEVEEEFEVIDLVIEDEPAKE